MKTFKNAGGMVRMGRLTDTYPRIISDLLEKIYRVDGAPRSKFFRLARKQLMKEAGLKDLAADGIRIGRALL